MSMIDYSCDPLVECDPAEMNGKTIKSVNNDSVNVLLIEFTDGSFVAIEPQPVGDGIYSPVVWKRRNGSTTT